MAAAPLGTQQPEATPDQPARVLSPELLVLRHDFVREHRQGLAIELEDNAVRSQVRVHPVDRKTLFNEKFVLRIVFEDDLAQQAVDRHDRHLPGNSDLAAGRVRSEIFARLKLVLFIAALGVNEVLIVTFPQIRG